MIELNIGPIIAVLPKASQIWTLNFPFELYKGCREQGVCAFCPLFMRGSGIWCLGFLLLLSFFYSHITFQSNTTFPYGVLFVGSLS